MGTLEEKLLKWVNLEIEDKELEGEYFIEDKKITIISEKFIFESSLDGRIFTTPQIKIERADVQGEHRENRTFTTKYIRESSDAMQFHKDNLVDQLKYYGFLPDVGRKCMLYSLEINSYNAKEGFIITIQDNLNDIRIFNHNKYSCTTIDSIGKALEAQGFKYQNMQYVLIIKTFDIEQLKAKRKELNDKYNTIVNLYDVNFDGYYMCSSCGLPIYFRSRCNC